MKNYIYLTLLLFTVSCSSIPKMNTELKKNINSKSFYYEQIGKNSFKCSITTNILSPAAKVNLKSQLINYDEADSLERLKLDVVFSSESIDSVDFNAPNLKPFNKELARYKIQPLIDASLKIIELDLKVINTNLMLPILQLDQIHRIKKETSLAYHIVPRGGGKFEYVVFKDMSKVVFDSGNKDDESQILFNKVDNYNFRSQYTITDKKRELSAKYYFFYDSNSKPPQPQRIVVDKVDFDLRLAYSYEFLSCDL